MKEIFRFFHKCFFALQKFKSFFILSIFFDALLQGIKLIEPWILASMLDSLYKNSKDVFLQKVATLSLIIIMQITLSYIFIRLKSYVTRGVNAVCKKNICLLLCSFQFAQFIVHYPPVKTKVEPFFPL